MTEHGQIAELLPGYALDCLDTEELTAVSEHLAGCAECRTELNAYRSMVGQLALASPDVAPPPDLKRRLLNRVHPQPVPPPAASWWHSFGGFLRRTAPAWGLASLVLVVALVAMNLLLWQQLAQSHTPTAVARITVVPMQGTADAPDASGIVAMSADGEYGTLVVQGLSPLSPEQQYQLWLIRDGQRTSGAVFSVNAEGYTAAVISSASPLSSYQAFGITVEPAGGSPGPTGTKVLGGTL
jgi:anti-sigma-K factor RskA